MRGAIEGEEIIPPPTRPLLCTRFKEAHDSLVQQVDVRDRNVASEAVDARKPLNCTASRGLGELLKSSSDGSATGEMLKLGELGEGRKGDGDSELFLQEPEVSSRAGVGMKEPLSDCPTSGNELLPLAKLTPMPFELAALEDSPGAHILREPSAACHGTPMHSETACSLGS